MEILDSVDNSDIPKEILDQLAGLADGTLQNDKLVLLFRTLSKWCGEEYNRRGEKQLTDYLDLYNAKKGYLVSFNFNRNKKTGVEWIQIGDKSILEAVV